MDTYRTEEEQVEALRRWWDENGRSTMLAVVLAVGAGFGWQGWQQHQQEQAEIASQQYEALLEATQQASSEEQLATVTHLANGITADYPSTTYAHFARLHLARMAVLDGDYDAAEAELRQVLTASPPQEIEQITQLRLARVIAAKGNPQGGLEIITSAEPGSFAPAYAEAEGDMQLQMGNDSAAIAAFERAASLAAAAGSGASEALQLKLQTLTPVPARELPQLAATDAVTAPEIETEIETAVAADEE